MATFMIRAKFDFLKQAVGLACQDDWGKTYPTVQEALESAEKALFHLSNQVAAAKFSEYDER